jgi:hypothetical protein
MKSQKHPSSQPFSRGEKGFEPSPLGREQGEGGCCCAIEAE